MVGNTICNRVGFLKSFLSRLLLSYTIIMITILFLFAFITIQIVSERLVNNEIAIQKRIAEDVTIYIDKAINTSQRIIQKIYLSDPETQEIIFSRFESVIQSDRTKYILFRERFETFFYTELYAAADIDDIILVDVNCSNMFYFKKNARKVKENFDFKVYPWFTEAIDNKTTLRILPTYRPEFIENDNNLVFSTVTCIWDSTNYSSGKVIGLMIISYDVERIKNAYSKYDDSKKGDVMIFNQQGDVIFDSSGRFYDREFLYFNKLMSDSNRIKMDQESIVSVDTSSRNGFITAVIVPEGQVFKSINLIKRLLILILLICILVSFMAIFTNSYYMSRKINVIANAMKKVEEGGLETRIPLSGKTDEISGIYSNFNVMCERLENFIEREYIAEIRLKEAELFELQSQINPHFLYNTLEAIRMKAIIADDYDVSKMIYALATLFRSSIKNKDVIVRIEDEIKYCKSYLDIHKIRYGDKLKIEINVVQDIMKYGIPKFILQPLIENAVLYGMDASVDTMSITVHGYRWDDKVVINITDNGRGMDRELLEKVRASLNEKRRARYTENIGLRNVNERIKIFFGEENSLYITSRKNTGTSATITIPAMIKEEMTAYVQGFNR